jgi:hypothetical protein
MGWRFFPGEHYPNYAQMLNLGTFSAREIALKMAQALHFADGVDDTYSVEIAPHLDAAKSLIERLGIANG